MIEAVTKAIGVPLVKQRVDLGKAEALRLWGVDVLIVELHDDVRAGIATAQVRQYR